MTCGKPFGQSLLVFEKLSGERCRGRGWNEGYNVSVWLASTGRRYQLKRHPALQADPIYLDYNATTPVDPEVVEAMQPYLSTYFGNPSSAHTYGQATNRAIDRARQQVANVLHCSSAEIIFTGGGSESDNLAIRGVALSRRNKGNHIITQVTEHPAVLNVCRALERLHGFRVTYLPVDAVGALDRQMSRQRLMSRLC